VTDLEADEGPPRRLIAGAVGPERVAYRKDRDEPRWFEPLHVRAPSRSRDMMADLVVAGADVVVAPTWLTHRRALLPVGETRRAEAWTVAAIRLAREAVESGLERRERRSEEAAAVAERARDGRDAQGDALPDVDRAVARDAAARAEEAASVAGARGAGVAGGALTVDVPRHPTFVAGAPPADVPRHPVLVAGVLPALDVAPEQGVGRLLPRDVASERDARAQAGLLAEAGADLILVEGNPSIAQARVAVNAAVEAGLPVWVAQPVAGARVPTLPSGESVEAWAEAMTHAGASVLLLAPAPGAGLPDAFAALQAAGVVAAVSGALPAFAGATDADRVGAASIRWLEAGAWHLGIADGATPERMGAMRAALDAIDAHRLGARAATHARWAEHVGAAARRAPGGRAAWVGGRGPASVPLPAGFHWAVVAEDAVGSLPAGELRLVIATTAAPLDLLSASLEPGGVLLAISADPAALAPAGLRILELSVLGERTAILARRDP